MEVNNWMNVITVVTPDTLEATKDLTKFEVFVEKLKENLQMVYQGSPFTIKLAASIDGFLRREFDKYSYKYNEPRLIHHNGEIVDVTKKLYTTIFTVIGSNLHIQVEFVLPEELPSPYEG